MIKYKNISCFPLTFYGVTFNPNETKEVSKFINHPKMIRVKELQEVAPKSIISFAKAEANIETKPKSVEEKPKRHYNRKNKNTNQ